MTKLFIRCCKKQRRKCSCRSIMYIAKNDQKSEVGYV